eukprot:c10705_g1_i2.p1 GENE.c10705_g1_i2~~c10705_g1_i2.p1  ORF type:complete len:571 (+),score=97.73 c10705_g1_i2:135-1847(+)
MVTSVNFVDVVTNDAFDLVFFALDIPTIVCLRSACSALRKRCNFSHIKTLNKSTKFKDASFLAPLKWLSFIEVSASDLDVEFFTQFHLLSRLDVCTVTCPNGLQAFAKLPNLTHLSLVATLRPEVGEVHLLSNLQELSLHGFRALNVEHLTQLPHLKSLSLTNVELVSPSALSRCKVKSLVLRTLQVQVVDIFDMNHQHLSQHLEHLELEDIHFSSLTLPFVPSLKSVRLSHLEVPIVHGLSHLPNLQLLKLYRCESLTTLEHSTNCWGHNMKELDIELCQSLSNLGTMSCNNLSTFRVLHSSRVPLPTPFVSEQVAQCPPISALHIERMDLDSLMPLLAHHNLTHLSLVGVTVRDMQPAQLEALARLSLVFLPRLLYADMSFARCNCLTHFISLLNPASLENLNLSETSIASLEPVSRLVNLKSLVLEGCGGIISLVPLAKLSKLEHLNINGLYALTSIAPLNQLANLNRLDVNISVQLYAMSSREPLREVDQKMRVQLSKLGIEPIVCAQIKQGCRVEQRFALRQWFEQGTPQSNSGITPQTQIRSSVVDFVRSIFKSSNSRARVELR